MNVSSGGGGGGGGDDDCGDGGGRSVGDYVKNLHGGKYRFADASSSGCVGEEFAESLYGGGGGDDCSAMVDDDEDMPRWAMRLGPPPPGSAAEGASGTLQVNTSGTREGEASTFSIANEERTWEKFYAVVVDRRRSNSSAGDGGAKTGGELATMTSPFSVVPATGHLAPRGGASNVCDPSRPYSDTAQITVSYRGNSDDDVDFDAVGREWWLIVGTEEETWTYRIELKQ